MEEHAYHIKGFEDLDETKICYWKVGNNEWLLYLPGCGIGNLRNHIVTENGDGTISVSPSIIVTAHDQDNLIQRHGYLTKGVWKEED